MPRCFQKLLILPTVVLASAAVIATASPAMAASSSGTKVCGSSYTPYLKATTSGTAVFYAPGDSSAQVFVDAGTHTVYGNPGGGAWSVSAPTLSGVSTGCAPFSR